MLHRNTGVYHATRHNPEGSWLHCQHFTSDSFLLQQEISQGHSVITRERNVKCLSLMILHCGKVALRSLPPQKFARPLRLDSDKEMVRFYRGIIYFQKVTRRKCDDSHPYACVHKLTNARQHHVQMSYTECHPKRTINMESKKKNVRSFLYRPI